MEKGLSFPEDSLVPEEILEAENAVLNWENLCSDRTRSPVDDKMGKKAILQFNLVSNRIEAF